MKARYIEIYKLRGVLEVIGSERLELVSNGDCRVYLTSQAPDETEHLRRRHACGIMLASSLMGEARMPGATPRQRFEAALARVRAPAGLEGDGLILVVDCLIDVPEPNSRHIVELGDLAIGLGLIGEDDLQKRALVVRSAALTALALAGFEQPIGGGLLIGAVTLASDESDERPIYVVNPSASATVTVQQKLLPEQAHEAAEFAQALLALPSNLVNVPRLLALSEETGGDRLRCFLAAWAGLEIFTSAAFKPYEADFMGAVQAAVPSGTAALVRRLQEVMSDKYRLADRFTIIASALSPEDADADLSVFRVLKKARDDFAHSMSSDPGALPLEDTQRLLRKYLRLHLLPD